MIILHVSLYDRCLLFWGEASLAEPIPRAKRSTPKSAGTAPGTYAYDAGSSRLSEALKQSAVTFKPSKRSFKEFRAWLPSKGAQPIPSSPPHRRSSQLQGQGQNVALERDRIATGNGRSSGAALHLHG